MTRKDHILDRLDEIDSMGPAKPYREKDRLVDELRAILRAE